MVAHEGRKWWQTQRWCRSSACHNVCRLLSAQRHGNALLSGLPDGMLSRNISAFLRPDGGVVTGFDDGRVACIDAESGSLLWSTDLNIEPKSWSHRGRAMTAHAAISSIVVPPGGQQVVIGSDDGHVRLVDADTGRVLHDVEVANSAIQLAWVPRENYIAAGSEQGELVFLDMPSGIVIEVVDTFSPIRSLVFSLQRDVLVVGCGDGQLRLFTASGIFLDSVQLCSGTCSLWSLTLVAAGPIGNAVVAGSDDGKVLLYDFDLGQCMTWPVASQAVVSIAAFVCGELVLAGSLDGYIRVLNLVNGAVNIVVVVPVMCMSILTKISGLVLGSSDGCVMFFKMNLATETKPVCTLRFTPETVVHCISEL